MKKSLVLIGLLLALQAPVLSVRAEEAVAPAAPAAAVSAEEMKERIKYATQFADIKPIREAIDRDVEAVAASVPDADREDFLRFVQLRINYEKIEEDSIKTMAEMFTVPELKAMVTYYGSPEGQSAETKAQAYSAKLGPEVSKAIDAALMDAKLGPQ